MSRVLGPLRVPHHLLPEGAHPRCEEVHQQRSGPIPGHPVVRGTGYQRDPPVGHFVRRLRRILTGGRRVPKVAPIVANQRFLYAYWAAFRGLGQGDHQRPQPATRGGAKVGHRHRPIDTLVLYLVHGHLK